MKITKLKAREILDSRGIPTIETQITISEGSTTTTAKAGVPSGSSTGTSEAFELQDQDPSRYLGKGTLTAVNNVNTTIKQALSNQEINSQNQLDSTLIQLDGTPNKSRLGANAILSVSMAFCRASAQINGMELYEYIQQLSQNQKNDNRPKVTLTSDKNPLDLDAGRTANQRSQMEQRGNHQNLQNLQLQILIMEGGKHGNWATDIQEMMIVPKRERFATVAESLRAGSEIFTATHEILDSMSYSTGVGLEGAYAPKEVKSNTEAFEIILKGIENAGYKPGEEIGLSLDVAASEFYIEDHYSLRTEHKELSTDELINLYSEWIKIYPIWTIEDPLHEEDWAGWMKLTEILGNSNQIVGDDLLTTNPARIQKAIQNQACNSVLIKLNQIGTVSETIQAINLSHSAEFETIISHRSGETCDDFIADLLVGSDSWQSKFGGPDRGERVAKYNRLMEIESILLK